MERLLRQQDIAAMLGTTPGVAASILAARGVHPIDFGIGRSRGRRWLSSAVRQVMLDMHEAAQPKAKTARTPHHPPPTSARPGIPPPIKKPPIPERLSIYRITPRSAYPATASRHPHRPTVRRVVQEERAGPECRSVARCTALA